MLRGEAALVTGAGRGIGAAIAKALAEAGAAVACLDLDAGAATDVADAIAANGCVSAAVSADITSPDAMAAAIDSLPAQWRSLDIVVANAAAVTQPTPVVDLPFDAWSQAIAVNLTGTFVTAKTVIPLMPAGGRMILVASQLASAAQPGRAPYCASKAGVLHLARVLALELAERQIRVNSLSPGPTWTDRLGRFFPDRKAAEVSLSPDVPLGRLAEPEEIAAAALLLADPACGYVTGADLVVDGGYLVR
ncbi:MAG: SDR family oxidoreductase [Pseudomonadota bacterium]